MNDDIAMAHRAHTLHVDLDDHLRKYLDRKWDDPVPTEGDDDGR